MGKVEVVDADSKAQQLREGLDRTGMERLNRLLPELGEEAVKLEQTAWEVVDQDLLLLCRERVMAMLSGEGGEDPEELSARERAYLDFTEQFVFSVSSISDAQVDALLEHSSADEVNAFVYCLYVVEMTERVNIVAGKVLR